jgi:hypothetical protein
MQVCTACYFYLEFRQLNLTLGNDTFIYLFSLLQIFGVYALEIERREWINYPDRFRHVNIHLDLLHELLVDRQLAKATCRVEDVQAHVCGVGC